MGDGKSVGTGNSVGEAGGPESKTPELPTTAELPRSCGADSSATLVGASIVSTTSLAGLEGDGSSVGTGISGEDPNTAELDAPTTAELKFSSGRAENPAVASTVGASSMVATVCSTTDVAGDGISVGTGNASGESMGGAEALMAADGSSGATRKASGILGTSKGGRASSIGEVGEVGFSVGTAISTSVGDSRDDETPELLPSTGTSSSSTMT